jgi:cytochrome P450
MSSASLHSTAGPPAARASRRPPAPIPHADMLGFWGFFKALRANPIAAWSQAAYERPFVKLDGGRLRPDLLFVADPAMVRHVLLDRVSNYDKGDVVRRRLQPALGDGVLIAGEKSWRPQRRITAPLFQPRRIDAFFPDMLSVAKAEALRLADLGDDVVIDVHDAMIGLTYNVIARTAFSSETVSDPAAFSRAIADYFDTAGRVDLASYLRLPEWIPTIGRLRARPALKLFRREIGGIIDRRRQALTRHGVGGVPDDLLTRLLTSIDPQTGATLDPERVYDNTVTFLAAGHETTANVLAWTLFLLSEYPEWDQRVFEEITREIGTADPTPEALGRLTLTRQVIDEAMRLYPPAPLIPRIALEADQIGSIDVRAGTIVFTAPFISHRHRAFWSDPDAFDPTRFAPDKRDAIDRHVYFPFGVGPRVCIGAQFAIQEVLVALAVLLKRWRFVATEPDKVFPHATITLRPADKLPMRLERR